MDTWTPIATRPRKAHGPKDQLHWVELPDAPFSMKTAIQAEADGLIFKACRHYPDYVECVVRAAPGKCKDDAPTGRRVLKPVLNHGSRIRVMHGTPTAATSVLVGA